MQKKQGILFIVATPIGNLGDITLRAIETLKAVERIYAEDTRNSIRLLNHFSIDKPLHALHDHNEERKITEIAKRLQAGEDIALISDAGTPLISDPGYKLVRELAAQDCAIVPIPGVSALITALSVAGLATDRFAFEGFLPARSAARKQALEACREEPRTIIWYESSHRIQATAEDMLEVLGAARQLVIARELTKQFEQLYRGDVAGLLDWLAADANHRKGEFVVMLAGFEPPQNTSASELDHQRLLQVLVQELPVKQAARIAAELTPLSKNEAYQLALSLNKTG